MNLLDSFYKAKILLLGKENCAFKTAAAALIQSRRNRGAGATPPPRFWQIINPISIREDLLRPPHNCYLTPIGFSDLPTAL